MYEIGIEGLHQLFLEARSAAKYAREHYENFISREHAFTLYGPEAYNLGASVPSKLTPMRARKLLKSTRRKNHIIYELDSEYKVLRTIHMIDYTRADCTYHHFELDGIQYAYPFRGRDDRLYNDKITVLKYDQGRPTYYAIVSTGLLFAQFYEYPEPDKMNVSTYRYFHTAKTTMYGMPVDWDAPIGAMNSPVHRHCEEETPVEIDFSKWFR
jgi:hypothetical protein